MGSSCGRHRVFQPDGTGVRHLLQSHGFSINKIYVFQEGFDLDLSLSVLLKDKLNALLLRTFVNQILSAIFPSLDRVTIFGRTKLQLGGTELSRELIFSQSL
jgi:hypothetical protein